MKIEIEKLAWLGRAPEIVEVEVADGSVLKYDSQAKALNVENKSGQLRQMIPGVGAFRVLD
jgi:hypothetical protein